MDTCRQSIGVAEARTRKGGRRQRHWGRRAILVLVLSAVLVAVFSTLASATAVQAVRYQETDGRLRYSENWYSSTYYAYSAGAEKYTRAPGGTVWVPFTGTSVEWIAKTGPAMGIALVSIDGGASVKVDLYSPSTRYRQPVWNTGELTYGLHWVQITRSGTKNVSSGGTAITIDAVDVVGRLVWSTRYQENDPSVFYAYGWSTRWSPKYSGGKMKICVKPPVANITPITGVSVAYEPQVGGILLPGAAIVRFDGIKLNLIATKARDYGKAVVSVDGGPRLTIDLYSYTTKYKQKVYTTGFLAPGLHTVVISWSGHKNYYSKGYTIDIDAFDVTGVLGGTN